MRSPDWKPECSPRFEAFLWTRGGPFCLVRPPPCPPASTAPGESLHGGLHESSCGRRRRRGISNRQNVGEPAYYFLSNMKRSYPKAVRQITAARSSKVVSPPISVLRKFFFMSVFKFPSWPFQQSKQCYYSPSVVCCCTTFRKKCETEY